MKKRVLEWVNTPVVLEAMIRYKEGRLPRSMKLWVEKLLELNTNESKISF